MFFQSMPPPDPLLDRVVANVRRYDDTLPSITADEAIHSELQQGVFRRSRADATATLRTTNKNGVLQETRTYLTAHGKPVQPDHGQPIPFEVKGGFSSLPNDFFSPKRFHCYTMARVPHGSGDSTVEYSVTSSANSPEVCRVNGELLHGRIQIDTQSAEIRHVEVDRPAPPQNSEKYWLSYLACDYAPVSLGNETFWLPTLLTAVMNDGKGEFRARYSRFNRYTSAVTLLPATGSPDVPQH